VFERKHALQKRLCSLRRKRGEEIGGISGGRKELTNLEGQDSLGVCFGGFIIRKGVNREGGQSLTSCGGKKKHPLR